MQLRLTFATHRLVLPLSHQHALQSMIYALLARSTRGRKVHAAVPKFGERAFRGFVFGPLQGDRRVTFVGATPLMLFEGQTQLEIRTPLPELAEILEQVATPGTSLTLLKNPPFRLAEATRTATTPCRNNTADIRMLTPIVARRTIGKETVFYRPGQPEFAKLLRLNFQRKYRTLAGREPRPFAIEALEAGQGDMVRTDMKGSSLTAWGGTYRLRGEPDELNFLYDAGLGSKNSAGFGMFETIGKTGER